MPLPHSELRFITAELASGERVVWSGRPDPFAAMLSQHYAVLFAIAWLAMAGAGVSAAARSGETFGVIFGLLFVAIGVVILATPISAYRGARRTVIAITDRRLIVAKNGGRNIISVQLSGIRQVERIARRGRVTLRIPTALVSDGDGGQKVDYTDLHGLSEGDHAFRLLTQGV